MKGSTIRQKLYQTGTTQTKLARLLGITPQAVASILSASDVRTSTVERICEALKLPLAFFYEGSETAYDLENLEAEKNREIEYLRGKVAAYESALSRLRPVDK